MPSKACPMCHRTTSDRAPSCRRCGYQFGQPVEKTLQQLRKRRANARLLLGVMLLADLAVLGAIVFMEMHGVIVIVCAPLVFCLAWTIRAAQTMGIARDSIRALETRVPQARVVSDARSR